MADNAQSTESDRKAVHEKKQGLDADDTVYQPREKLFRKHCVFFHKLREVVQPRCCFSN